MKYIRRFSIENPYKPTEEHKKKISLSLNGRESILKGGKLPDETKNKISESCKKTFVNGRKPSGRLKGSKFTEEQKEYLKERIKFREKIRYWKDKKLSLETRQKMSYSRGIKKGWITPINMIIRHLPEYIKWRTEVFNRDNFQCQMVGCLKENPHKLEANHIKLFSTHPELRFDVNNGITLCKDCHKGIRHREWRFENLFNLIIDNYTMLRVSNDKLISKQKC